MSLKPTQKNQFQFGLSLSAKDWARNAIASEKRTGPEGFENYRSKGGWYFPMHYKSINGDSPEWSGCDAADEMGDVRASLVAEIESHAKELDEMIMRLQRMEEQINLVLP